MVYNNSQIKTPAEVSEPASLNNAYQYYPLPQEEEIDIVSLLKVFVKYWWLILLITSIGSISTFFYVNSFIPIYQSKAVVFMAGKSSSPSYASALSSLGMGSLLGSDSAPTDMIIRMIKCRRSLIDIINNFELVNYYNGQLTRKTFRLVEELSSDSSSSIYDATVKYGVVDSEGKIKEDIKNNIPELIRNLNGDLKNYDYRIEATLKAIQANIYKPNLFSFLSFINRPKSEVIKNEINLEKSKDFKMMNFENVISQVDSKLTIKADKSSFIVISYEDYSPVLCKNVVDFSIANLDRINNELEISSQKPLVIILDSAVKSYSPVKPNKKTMLIIGVLGSIILAVALSFVVDFSSKIFKKSK